MTDATNRLTNERIAEATDEEVRKIKRAVFRYRYAWGYRETEHSECIDDLEKLLARLERVETRARHLESHATFMAHLLKHLYEVDKVNYGTMDYKLVQDIWEMLTKKPG